jgi:hypothetical protein
MDAILLAAMLATAADYSQTHYAARHPQQFSEANPIIGTHPSPNKVLAFALVNEAALIGFHGTRYAVGFEVANIVAHGFAAGHNARIGVQMQF